MKDLQLAQFSLGKETQVLCDDLEDKGGEAGRRGFRIGGYMYTHG